MAHRQEETLDSLFEEYDAVFWTWDDLRLARWLSQTLGQLLDRVWRLSHPLVSAYQWAARVAHKRDIWLKRLVLFPEGFERAPCCQAPLLPLLTRDVLEAGLVCVHCGGTAVELSELPRSLRQSLARWAKTYAGWHEVAHWSEERINREQVDYEAEFERAARRAERLLRRAGTELAPRLLDLFPAAVWEDADECLEVRPEDVRL